MQKWLVPMNHSRGMKHGRDARGQLYIMSEQMHIHKHHSFATIQVMIHPIQNCVTQLTTKKSYDSQMNVCENVSLGK